MKPFFLAEKLAAQAIELPNFSGFSLLKAKEKIEELLNAIGKVDGIFATYTLHDISHAESMLGLIEWLIPQETQSKMTPVDWLMITLSIYCHDLGMVTTEQEFQSRDSNKDFCKFMEAIKQDKKGKDYLNRIEKLGQEERESFFFQEYIRYRHPMRVRDWILGNSKHHEVHTIKIIRQEIHELFQDLPARFKTSLATVCESHHRNDLNNTNRYPLYETYGPDNRENANIQYCAIILRSADLLHISKDRTPSMMYKLLNISDPLGIAEWEKQMGTFSVNKAKRTIDYSDPDSLEILVRADFEDERPFFSLSEYITYADSQIKQSTQWVQKSNRDADGKDYLFPWKAVRADLRVEGNIPTPLRFELDRGKLLDLLVGHTLYNDPTVVVRELLQNAIDAVRYKYHLDSKNDNKKAEIGSVDVSWEEDKRVLTVLDNGIGMDQYIIDNHLMKVGSSYYRSEDFENEENSFTPISRFGIGILTCFMVSDDVEIITCRESRGYRLRMSSVHSNYLLKEIDLGNPLLKDIEPHGTKVILKLRPSIDLGKKDILSILKYWIIIPPCKVFYADKKRDRLEIGFKNLDAVLEKFHSQDVTKYYKVAIDRKSEIYEEGLAKYRMAFVVGKGLSPEKNFPFSKELEAPAVCIEGIRVADRLPGLVKSPEHFEERGFRAIIAIEGNRNIRTTVSRDDLEVDEEYNKLTKISIDLLFRHVKSEIHRITKIPGNPVSRASTAVIWFLYRFKACYITKDAKQYLQEIENTIPSVVVERLLDKTLGTFERDLISRLELLRLKYFWTIDSRLSSYLTTISQDIGKEIEYNRFINQFSSKSSQPVDEAIVGLEDFLPLIIRPYHHFEFILRHFTPDVVICSQGNQRIVVRWSKEEKLSQFVEQIDRFNKLVDDKYMGKIGDALRESEITMDFYEASFDDVDSLRDAMFSIFVTNLQFDREEADAAVMGSLIFFNSKSGIYEDWEKLKNKILALLEEDDLDQISKFIFCIIYLYSICNIFSAGRRVYNYERREFLATWTKFYSKHEPFLEKNGLDWGPNLIEYIQSSRKWFSVKRFQLDWDSTHYYF